MTQKQFDTCVQNNIPIYEIWIKEKLHKKKISYNEVARCIDWINTVIPYSTTLHCEVMYVSEDKFDKSVNKLLTYLEKQEKEKITEATKKLKYLKQVKKVIKGDVNHD